MKFDENLREFRKEKGYSQEELADKLNVSRQTVSKWENGSAMPDLKKLTELAEFFGVSMDDLLGIEVDGCRTAAGNNADFEAYVKYTDQRIAALEESKNQGSKKKSMVAIYVGIVALCLFFIWFFNYSVSIRNELNSLSNYIQNLQNQIYYMDNSGNENYWESKSDDVTVSFLSVDRNKPYIVKAELKYAPVSYTKGSKVYFSVPKADKSIEKLEATEENGEFILTTDIDITIDGAYYFFLDDGNEIVKEELYINPSDLYCEFISYENSGIHYVLYEQNGSGNDNYYLENIFDSSELCWRGIASNKLVSAQLIVESGGKEAANIELEIKQRDDSKNFIIGLSKHSVRLTDTSDINVYLLATDELGVVYKHYISLDMAFDNGFSSGAINYPENYDVLIFDIEGRGKVTVGEEYFKESF